MKIRDMEDEQFLALMKKLQVEHLEPSLKSIIKTEQEAANHPCRYDISPEDLGEVVRFFKAFSSAVEDSKTVVRRALLVFFLLGFLGLAGLGFWTKAKGG